MSVPDEYPTQTDDELDDLLIEEQKIEEEETEEEFKEEEEDEEIKTLFSRLKSETSFPLRVHDVIVAGNTKTMDSVIEAKVTEILRSATTVPELLAAPTTANRMFFPDEIRGFI